jgi:hypothetical protein
MRARMVRPEAPPAGVVIVQIAAASSAFGNGHCVETLIALGDDGRIWRIPIVGGKDGARDWQLVPPVPVAAQMIPVVEFNQPGEVE